MNYKIALRIATKYHKGQFRKLSGLKYITHPIAVAAKFKKQEYKIVAVLHDVIEDTNMTLDILKTLGVSDKLRHSIDLLTHPKWMSYLNYILLLKNDDIARAVKLEDLKHNLSDIEDEKLKEKYLLAQYILELRDGKYDIDA